MHLKKHSIRAFPHLSFSLGNQNSDHNKLKQSFYSLSVNLHKTFTLMEAGIILDQDSCELQRNLVYKIGTRSEIIVVLTELGLLVSGPMIGSDKPKIFAISLLQNMWEWLGIFKCIGHRLHASKIRIISQSRKELQSEKMQESNSKFTGERYEVGRVWSEPESILPDKFS